MTAAPLPPPCARARARARTLTTTATLYYPCHAQQWRMPGFRYKGGGGGLFGRGGGYEGYDF